MKKVLILGAGGLGKAIHESFSSRDEYKVVGFLDDAKQGMFCELPVLGPLSDVLAIARAKKVSHVIVALGYRFQTERRELFKKLEKEKSIAFANAIHRQVSLARDVRLGKGVFLGINVAVNTGTRIGDNCVIWSGAIIEHDNEIGENVFIATGAMTAGYVTIEDDVFVGMGAMIAKSRIGNNATVGAGSVVLKDVEPSGFVTGAPAKLNMRKTQRSYLVSNR